MDFDCFIEIRAKTTNFKIFLKSENKDFLGSLNDL